MDRPTFPDRISNRLSELAIRRSGRTPAGSLLKAFVQFFVRLNRFYNRLYEKAKPGWMKRPPGR